MSLLTTAAHSIMNETISLASMSAEGTTPYSLSNNNNTETTTTTTTTHTITSVIHPLKFKFNHTLLEDIINNMTMYTTTNGKYHEDTFCYPTLKMPITNIISIVLYAIVFFIGLFGNTLVIYVVLRFSKMQTVTNMYILNLAIADECYLICIPFLITTIHLEEWIFGKTFCNIYLISASITQFTSSIFLFILSADRYIAVCHPISSPKYRSPFISKCVTLCAWTVSALMMLPVMLYANTIKNYQNDKMSCGIIWPQNNNGSNGSGRTFTLYTFILGFATPLCLIFIFYFMVIKKLQTVGPKSKSKEKKRSHRKVTKLVLTVITVYILCWLPYWISQVALVISTQIDCLTHLERTVFVLAGCLGYSNSAMNPILYAFLSDNFKKSFVKAFTCRAGKDFNTQLQIENSYFRGGAGKRNSDAKNSSTSLKYIPAKQQQQQQQKNQLQTTSQKLLQSSHLQNCDLNIVESPVIVYDKDDRNNDIINCNFDNGHSSSTTSIQINTNKTTTTNNTTTANTTTTTIIDDNNKPPILHTDF